MKFIPRQNLLFDSTKLRLTGVFLVAFTFGLSATWWYKHAPNNAGIITAINQSKAVLINPLLDCDRRISTSKLIVNRMLHLSTEQDLGLINPLFDCEVVPIRELPNPGVLRGKIVSTINQEKRIGDISDVAVYFRGLRSGDWFGVNENAKFSPASLLKVVLMLAYFKQAQYDPDILNDTLIYDQDIDYNTVEHYRSKTKGSLIKGQSYSINDLISRMIVNSGNNSTYLLNQNIDDKSFNAVYTDLALTPPDFAKEYTLSAKLYSVFFRVLYNVTYLNREMSQKALDLLSHSTFTYGLVAGLPDGLVVAHKFGERQILEADGKDTGIKELHDCGIVYYPDHPYFLCVMTKGSDYTKLERVLANISRLVYEELNTYFASGNK